MGKSSFSLLAALAMAAFACDVPKPQAPVRIEIHLPVTRFVLSNGLEVIVQEDHATPRVAVNLRYHVGYKDDPIGNAGVAHLVEHLQFAESAHTRPDSFYRTMTTLGAEDVNGTTEPDATNYFETVPSSSLEAALWVEADRMASARLGWSEASVAREKNVVAQELRLRYRNEPNGYRYHLLTRAVYPDGHPYRMTLDEEREMRAATPEGLREFALHFYGPDDATLILVGDVDATRVREMVTRYFGSIEACAARPAGTVPPVVAAAYKRMRVAADVDLPLVFVAWPLPAASEDGYYEAPYAMRQLTGSVRWFTEEEKKEMRPHSVGWNVDDHRLGSLGYIYGVPADGERPEDLLDAVEVMRHRIMSYEWSDLASQRSYEIAEEVRDVEALGDRARRMQRYLELFGQADYVMASLHKVQDVTPRRMLAAVDRFLDPERAALIVVTPDKSAPRSGRVVEEVKR